MKTFDARIGNLTNENAFLRILVNNATDHANNLKKLSDFLQSLLRDPNKYAEKALRAAEAYGNIVKAIEEVLKLAREANANSKIALDLVSLFFSSRDGLLGLQGGGGFFTLTTTTSLNPPRGRFLHIVLNTGCLDPGDYVLDQRNRLIGEAN